MPNPFKKAVPFPDARPIPTTEYTPWRAVKFYIPLVIQSASQSLTYPLVAAVAAHGALGAAGLAPFAQGLAVMFVVGAIGGGLLTTGMVFGRTAEGFRQFKRLNIRMTAVLLLIQGGACLPEVDQIIFRSILGLAPPMDEIARQVVLYSIPLQLLFFLRHPPLVALYNARASAAANWATLARIALTGALAPLFIRWGGVGHGMAILAMTIPVALEMILTTLFARPYIRGLAVVREEVLKFESSKVLKLHETDSPPKAENGKGTLELSNSRTLDLPPHAPLRTQLFFTIPISFGGVMLAISGFMVGAFIARADEAARMFPIHVVTMGIINAVSFAAIRMQAVVLAFPLHDRRATSIFRFALVAGGVLTLFPLMAEIPVAARWYFGTAQNLPAPDIPLALRATLIIAALPIVQAMRGHAEGLAAWMKRPNAILAGQAVYLAAMVCTLFVCLNVGVPGYLMGIAAIWVSTLLSFFTVRMGLLWAELEDEFDTPPRGQRPTEG